MAMVSNEQEETDHEKNHSVYGVYLFRGGDGLRL
jgi:hypothetical protein